MTILEEKHGQTIVTLLVTIGYVLFVWVLALLLRLLGLEVYAGVIIAAGIYICGLIVACTRVVLKQITVLGQNLKK